MPRAPRSSFVFLAVAALSCAPNEPPPAVAPSPVLPPAPAPSTVVLAPAPTAAPAPAAAPLAPPVMAKFVDVASAGAKLPVGSRCDTVFVAVVKGTVTAAGQALLAGDVLEASRFDAPGSLDLSGKGVAVAVTALHDCGGSAPSAGPLVTKVARAGDAKDLAWAGGAMHAHLDLEGAASPDVYVGRLEGTAPVAEHDHPSAWEVLCAYEGAGTFTLDGVPRHIVAPSVVAVPPGRKHAWQPDPGTKLMAVQVYAPPGPEQRFKALAGK